MRVQRRGIEIQFDTLKTTYLVLEGIDRSDDDATEIATKAVEKLIRYFINHWLSTTS